MSEKKLEEIKEELTKISFSNIGHCVNTNLILNYITNLENIADKRMQTIIKIENYCIDEKEDLIGGGEVCEDVLNIINNLKEQE